MFFGGSIGPFLRHYQTNAADLVDAFTTRDTSTWHPSAFNWPLPAVCTGPHRLLHSNRNAI